MAATLFPDEDINIMSNIINGIDTAAIAQWADSLKTPEGNPKMKFGVNTRWDGQTRSVATVDDYEFNGERYARKHEIVGDEPLELGGQDTGANPVELLMAGLNACMTVGYVTVAAMMGVNIKSLRIETSGELDARGFLGIDESIGANFNEVHYTVHIESDGTSEQVEQIHQQVLKTSVNLNNLSNSIRMVPTLNIMNM